MLMHMYTNVLVRIIPVFVLSMGNNWNGIAHKWNPHVQLETLCMTPVTVRLTMCTQYHSVRWLK